MTSNLAAILGATKALDVIYSRAVDRLADANACVDDHKVVLEDAIARKAPRSEVLRLAGGRDYALERACACYLRVRELERVSLLLAGFAARAMANDEPAHAIQAVARQVRALFGDPSEDNSRQEAA